MIIFKLLNLDDFYGMSENVEIAKGKYKIPLTIKDGFQQIKRKYKWQTKRVI
jgi:hypothetical protein